MLIMALDIDVPNWHCKLYKAVIAYLLSPLPLYNGLTAARGAVATFYGLADRSF